MSITCPICSQPTTFLIEKKDRFGQSYQYFKCISCRFLFDRDLVLDKKALQAKVGKVYQGDYFEGIDSGWKVRGDAFLKVLNVAVKAYSFLKMNKKVSVLDYGGGNGYITSKVAPGVDVFFYDKYEKPTYQGNYTVLEKPKVVDIIFAVELVEHLADMDEWRFLKDLAPGMFMFTTGLSDNIADTDLAAWEYVNPDAGHSALYSTKSLYLLGKKYGFAYFFFPNISTHIFLRNVFLSRIYFVKIEYAIYSLLRKIKNLVA